jgi:hypothetical protein
VNVGFCFYFLLGGGVVREEGILELEDVSRKSSKGKTRGGKMKDIDIMLGLRMKGAGERRETNKDGDV